MFLTVCFPPEPASVYEMKLGAFNGNGESEGSRRLVSLGDEDTSSQSDGEPGCHGDDDVQKLRFSNQIKTLVFLSALIHFDLHVIGVRREEGLSMRGRRGVPGQRGHRRPHRHRLHHLLRPLPGVWVPPQVSPAPSHLYNQVSISLTRWPFSSLFCSKGTGENWSGPGDGSKPPGAEPSLQVAAGGNTCTWKRCYYDQIGDFQLVFFCVVMETFPRSGGSAIAVSGDR